MTASIRIRDETAADHESIATVTRTAFAQLAHSSQTESSIIGALRRAGALTVSLVAEAHGEVAGHVAFSPVRVVLATGAVEGGEVTGWYGLGPLSVSPARQRQGVGSALVRAGLARLMSRGARGCVVLGEPDYYRRFGFRHHPRLVADGLPADYFMALSFDGEPARATVTYHPAFFAAE